jgi:triacylglycerol esterase/lipase EstA (alpha/beta hydrolase family)
MRRPAVLLVLVALLGIGTSPAWADGPAPAVAGPALEEPADDLAAALRCPSTFTHPDREVVLLVHGTAVTAEEHWGWNYAKHLPATGRDVCTVALPDRALGDIQTSAEYVVAAVRTLAATHGEVDLIGHSQGSIVPRWAIRWWPDVAAAVDDAVLLAGPHHGTVATDVACGAGSCAPAAWQMRPGSDFITALNAGDETPGDVSWSSIYSQTDELVQPFSTAVLDGAANVAIQDLCPGRPVHHAGLNSDPVVWALVLGALDAAGPADASTVDPVSCVKPSYPGATVADVVGGNLLLYGNGALALAQHEQVRSEPALRGYAGGGRATA